MQKYLLIIIAIVLLGCSSSDDNRFSACVETSLLPFPPEVAAFQFNGYVAVEVNFDNGSVIADGVIHGDSECSVTDTPFRLFEGTYTVGDTTTSMTGDPVNTVRFVGDDGLFL